MPIRSDSDAIIAIEMHESVSDTLHSKSTSDCVCMWINNNSILSNAKQASATHARRRCLLNQIKSRDDGSSGHDDLR